MAWRTIQFLQKAAAFKAFHAPVAQRCQGFRCAQTAAAARRWPAPWAAWPPCARARSCAAGANRPRCASSRGRAAHGPGSAHRPAPGSALACQRVHVVGRIARQHPAACGAARAGQRAAPAVWRLRLLQRPRRTLTEVSCKPPQCALAGVFRAARQIPSAPAPAARAPAPCLPTRPRPRSSPGHRPAAKKPGCRRAKTTGGPPGRAGVRTSAAWQWRAGCRGHVEVHAKLARVLLARPSHTTVRAAGTGAGTTSTCGW
jgi:hypothetical protein